MSVQDLKDPEDRTRTGTKIKYLFCPECGHYSGGGVCRQCGRWDTATEVETFTALVCGPGGSQVVAVPSAGQEPQPITEFDYKHTTITGWEAVEIVALVNIRGTVPRGTKGRTTAKRGGMFTVRFETGHTLVKVPYTQLGLAW